jgi:exonuclease VII large subunit
MRRTSYMKRAAKRFLAGTRMKTPVEAVEAGVCSLQEWVRVLAEEREVEQQYLLERHARYTKHHLRSNTPFRNPKSQSNQVSSELKA